MNPLPTTEDRVSEYRSRAERFAAAADAQRRRAERLSYARMGVFAVAIGLFVWAEIADYRGVLVLGGVLALLGFLALVVAHDRVRERLRRLEALRDTNTDAIARVRRNWSELPPLDALVDPMHGYAHDLDVVGRASLYRLVGYDTTPPGRAALLEWLLSPADPETARERQAAVAELAVDVDLRDEVSARARLMGRSHPAAMQRFFGWAEDEPWLRSRPALLWTVRIAPVLTVALVVLQLLDVVPAALWLLPLMVHLLVMYRFDKRVRDTFGRSSPAPEAFEQYAELFGMICRMQPRSELLRGLQERLITDGTPAEAQLRRLGRMAHLAGFRGSMLHFPLYVLTLFDFHVVAALERWQHLVGPHVREWFEALGEVDALAALAELAYDHPDWVFPVLEPGPTPVFDAAALGHPLIPSGARVDNDVSLGPPGTFLLVTGSNMSGKSTLLRAIGLNTVLAQAGAPVCAGSLRLPPAAVLTSMRVSDSLEQGVSYFMAELRRLKSVVDAADALRGSDGPVPLYLLDEILGGTNTAERQVAVRQVVRHLLDVGAIGAITTHDLGLADLPEIAETAVPVHFEEHFAATDDGEETMTFDYVLRPGVATSVNALRLMRLIGLRLDDEPRGAKR